MASLGADLHDPVMVSRILELLAPALSQGGLLVDATLGMGGHSEAVLDRFPSASVLGFDRDLQAIAIADQRLARFGDRFSAVHAVFDEFSGELARRNSDYPAAFLFDLGVSSLQIDSDSRGFAYSRDTPLDMRMDQTDPLTAQDVVNTYTGEELARVIWQYGEERNSKRIARAICAERQTRRIETTGQLAAVVERATPAARRRKGHPAKRVFQAIRIEVNDELGALRRAVSQAVESVGVHGRIVVLSYHSLEDKIVKGCFSEGLNPDVPPGLPIIPEDRKPWLLALTRGIERPGPDEAADNPRSMSARLRGVEKLRAWPEPGGAVT